MTTILNDRQFNILGYQVNGYGFKLYCKITEYAINTDDYKCTMSFGTGFRKFCFVASYSCKNPYDIYIDHVERKDNCIINNSLSKFEEGTVKLVKLALWTITKLYPHVKKYTLKDDSQIPCDGENSKDTMYLGFDYILKYNETWYQNKFNAELDGFISKHRNNKSQLTNITSQKGSLMESVYNSFKVLDEKIVPIELVSDLISNILEHREEYSTSRTPREFINKLRIKYGKQYCNIVGKWLNKYMLYLNISVKMDDWFILKKNIIEPSNFSIKRLSYTDIKQKLNGGRMDTKKNNYNKYYSIISKYTLSS